MPRLRLVGMRSSVRGEVMSTEEPETGEELKAFQLRSEGLLKELTEQDGVEVYGNLRIVVADIDKIAFLKGNTIYISVITRRYPEFVLKYILH
jgi:hypothetical protein